MLYILQLIIAHVKEVKKMSDWGAHFDFISKRSITECFSK